MKGTHMHLFIGLFSMRTWVDWYQNGKTFRRSKRWWVGGAVTVSSSVSYANQTDCYASTSLHQFHSIVIFAYLNKRCNSWVQIIIQESDGNQKSSQIIVYNVTKRHRNASFPLLGWCIITFLGGRKRAGSMAKGHPLPYHSPHSISCYRRSKLNHNLL